MQTLLIILEKGSSCAAFEFPFQRTFPLTATGDVWRWGMSCSDTKNRKSWSEVFRSWGDGRITRVDTKRPDWSCLSLGEHGTGCDEVKRRNAELGLEVRKSFLRHKQLRYNWNFFRVMCSSEKGWGIFFFGHFLVSWPMFIFANQLASKLCFPLFLAGSKPMEVQQLPLDELKNK